MGRSKDLFMRLLEEMFNDSMEENMYQEDKRRKQSETYTHEAYEITKGDYKTQLDILFSKDGYPVGVKLRAEMIQKPKVPEKDLQEQLNMALEKEDYEAAARIQKEMKEFNSLKEPTK
jgi:hypothetical protein